MTTIPRHTSISFVQTLEAIREDIQRYSRPIGIVNKPPEYHQNGAASGMQPAQLPFMNRLGGLYATLSLLGSLIKSLYYHPSITGVVYYRLGRWLWLNRTNLYLWPIYILHRIFYPLIRIYSGLELLPFTDIGPGLKVIHFGPTVVHPNTVAGKNLTLRHGVTIGLAETGVPRFGDNVTIGAGATVIGGISIGNDVIIGAGAVVTYSVPDNTTVVGIPARPLSVPPTV